MVSVIAPSDGQISYLFAALTPDNDVYLEDYSGNDVNITAVRFSRDLRHLPAGLPRQQVYRFKDVSAPEPNRLSSLKLEERM